MGFAATLAAFLIIDAAWLMLVAVEKFQAQLGPILRTEPNFTAAAAFYPVYAFGLFVLAVRPAMAERSLSMAAIRGAVLGLTAYATFDLTNLAILSGWTVGLATMDIGWGTLASSFAAVIGYIAGSRASVGGAISEDRT